MKKFKNTGIFTAVILCMVCLCPGASFAGNVLEDYGFEVVTDSPGFEIGAAVYTDGNGELLTGIPAGGVLKSSVGFMNISAEEKNISVICALYNADNSMEDISAKVTSLGVKKRTTVENTLNIPAEADDSWCVRTYVLETLGNMHSYCESFSFPPKASHGTKWEMGSAFSLSAEKVYGGESSLKIKGEASECLQPVLLNKNSMYKMSFFGTGNNSLGFGIYDKAGGLLSEEKTFDGSNDWIINSLLFKSSEDEEAVVKFNHNGSGSGFIDNVSLSDNIIINGDFEDSELGWMVDETCFEVSKADAYEGKRALKITSKSSGKRAYQETEVIAHSKGMISFKSKCAEDIYFKVLDADSNELISKTGTTLSASSSWKDNNIYINTMGYDKVKLCFETKTSAGKISYIDDVKFTNLMYPDELVNSDFENGTEGWSTTYASVTNSTDEVFSGEASGQLTERTKVYGSLSQKVEDILNKYGPGMYYLEAYIKPQLDITGGWVVARVAYTPKGGSEIKKSISFSNPKSEWNKISGTVELTWEDGVSGATIIFETSQRTEDAALTCDLYIDDVSFFKMPD